MTGRAARATMDVAVPSQRNGSAAFTTIFSVAIAGLIALGWQLRDEYYYGADYGAGYAMGIAGGVMMLLLLLYPLRKHLRFMHHWLPLRHWFRLHMLLGVVGPLCILYHCNFSLGSTNSNVALLCMGLMVSSGLVGRFIYARIHYGLYGQRATLLELQRARLFSEQRLAEDPHLTAELREQLHQLEQMALRKMSTLASASRLFSFGIRARLWLWRWSSQLNAAERALLACHLDTLRRIAGFSFFERLFSLWHLLHMPIFFMLVITGLAHVYAVHSY